MYSHSLILLQQVWLETKVILFVGSAYHQTDIVSLYSLSSLEWWDPTEPTRFVKVHLDLSCLTDLPTPDIIRSRPQTDVQSVHQTERKTIHSLGETA